MGKKRRQQSVHVFCSLIKQKERPQLMSHFAFALFLCLLLMYDMNHTAMGYVCPLFGHDFKKPKQKIKKMIY